MKFLIAGLGNIGDEYIETRHNAGFKIVEALAAEAGASFILERLAMHASFRLKGKSIHLIKPTTYMNLSGRAVRYWMDKLEVNRENLLIVVDDLALPFGEIRIRSKGSDGNHNGLKSIQELLPGTDYSRLRFGIDGNFMKGRQVDYVLGQWTTDEKKILPEKIQLAAEAIKSFIVTGPERTMNVFNKAGS